MAWAALKVPEGKFVDIEPMFIDFDGDDLLSLTVGDIEDYLTPGVQKFRTVIFYNRFILPYKRARHQDDDAPPAYWDHR